MNLCHTHDSERSNRSCTFLVSPFAEISNHNEVDIFNKAQNKRIMHMLEYAEYGCEAVGGM